MEEERKKQEKKFGPGASINVSLSGGQLTLEVCFTHCTEPRKMVTGGGAAEGDCISRKIVVVGDSGVGKVQPTLSSIADHRPLPILSTQANIVKYQKEWDL